MIPALLLFLGSQDRPPEGTLRLHGTLESVDLRSERASIEVESYVDSRGLETTLGKPEVHSLSLGRVPIRSLKSQALGSLRDLKPGQGDNPQQPAAAPLDRVEPEVLQRFLDSANAYRKRYSAGPLQGDVRLSGIAMAQARRMSTEGKTSSDSLEKSFLDEAKEFGYRGRRIKAIVLVGEEDAWDALHAWLRQADARDALLDPALNLAGVGRVRDAGRAGRWFWCVLLGGP